VAVASQNSTVPAVAPVTVAVNVNVTAVPASTELPGAMASVVVVATGSAAADREKAQTNAAISRLTTAVVALDMVVSIPN
jgi:hypothetical protein